MFTNVAYVTSCMWHLYSATKTSVHAFISCRLLGLLQFAAIQDLSDGPVRKVPPNAVRCTPHPSTDRDVATTITSRRSASVALTSCPDIESPSNSRVWCMHRSLSGHTSAFLAGDIYSSSLKANVASFACLRPGYRTGNGSMGQHGSVHVDP